MTEHNILRAFAWMLGVILSFSAMALAVRGLGGALTVFEILAVRSVLGLGIVIVIALFQGQTWTSLRPRRLGLHATRNVLQFAGQSLWAWGVLLLPLATVFALEFTFPAWTMLLAILFLGERVTGSRIAAVILGILGVLVVLRPGIESFRPAALVVLASALVFAGSSVATKKLVATEPTTSMVVWMYVMQIPLALALSDLTFPLRLTWEHAPSIVGIAVTGILSQYCMPNAFRSGDASIVVSIDFLRIPLIAMLGWWLYSEPLDIYVFAGAALIVIGVMVNLRAETRRLAKPEAG